MNGELRVVADVPRAFAAIAAEEFADHPGPGQFGLGASGGNSGRACFRALAERDDIAWPKVDIYFSDERCVEVTSPDANQFAVGEALGARREELGAFYPMSCANGPAAYEARLRSASSLDLLQLGLGPDGHTASLFPGSTGLAVDDGRLVITNHDTLGDNPFERMSLTFEGIAQWKTVVIAVIGVARAGVVSRIVAGDDLPASRVVAPRVIWLVDQDAASLISEGGDG